MIMVRLFPNLERGMDTMYDFPPPLPAAAIRRSLTLRASRLLPRPGH